jgi:hypothetical protein
MYFCNYHKVKQLYIFLCLVCTCVSCGKMPDVEQEETLVLIPYPNPANERINIHIENDKRSAYVVQVFDPKADLIFEESVKTGDSKNSFSIDLRETSKGSYHFILKMNSAVYTKKFLKI